MQPTNNWINEKFQRLWARLATPYHTHRHIDSRIRYSQIECKHSSDEIIEISFLVVSQDASETNGKIHEEKPITTANGHIKLNAEPKEDVDANKQNSNEFIKIEKNANRKKRDTSADRSLKVNVTAKTVGQNEFGSVIGQLKYHLANSNSICLCV